MNHKCYIMIGLTFLKELMLIRQMNQKSAIFVIIGIINIHSVDLIIIVLLVELAKMRP